jgi:hypothetical protein
MSQTLVSGTTINAARVDLSQMIKDKVWAGLQQGLDERIVVRNVAKSLGKPTEYVLRQLSLAELPSSVIGLLKKHPISPHVAMSLWKRSNEDTGQTVQLLTKAINTAAAAGSTKVMLKHVV